MLLSTIGYANSFAAEVFLGRGSNKNLPNRRIATKEIAFNQPLKRGTRISCQVAVSAMRDITLAFWIGNDSNSNQQFTVDNSLKTNTLRHLHRLDTVQPKTLNAKSEIHILKTLAGHRLKNRNAVNDKQNNAKINNQISRIITADNPSDFYEEVYSEIESAKNDTPYKGYMYRIAKSFHPYWSDSQNNSILRICKSHFSDMAYQFHQDGYMLSQALIYIFLCDEDGKQFCMEMCDDANRKRSVYECFSRLNAEDLPLNKIDDYNVICERIGFSSESN